MPGQAHSVYCWCGGVCVNKQLPNCSVQQHACAGLLPVSLLTDFAAPVSDSPPRPAPRSPGRRISAPREMDIHSSSPPPHSVVRFDRRDVPWEPLPLITIIDEAGRGCGRCMAVWLSGRMAVCHPRASALPCLPCQLSTALNAAKVLCSVAGRLHVGPRSAMGLLLSMLIVCVGVFEALDSYYHFRAGLLPPAAAGGAASGWRYQLTNFNERWRRKPSAALTCGGGGGGGSGNEEAASLNPSSSAHDALGKNSLQDATPSPSSCNGHCQLNGHSRSRPPRWLNNQPEDTLGNGFGASPIEERKARNEVL